MVVFLGVARDRYSDAEAGSSHVATALERVSGSRVHHVLDGGARGSCDTRLLVCWVEDVRPDTLDWVGRSLDAVVGGLPWIDRAVSTVVAGPRGAVTRSPESTPATHVGIELDPGLGARTAGRARLRGPGLDPLVIAFGDGTHTRIVAVGS